MLDQRGTRSNKISSTYLKCKVHYIDHLFKNEIPVWVGYEIQHNKGKSDVASKNDYLFDFKNRNFLISFFMPPLEKGGILFCNCRSVGRSVSL